MFIPPHPMHPRLDCLSRGLENARTKEVSMSANKQLHVGTLALLCLKCHSPHLDCSRLSSLLSVLLPLSISSSCAPAECVQTHPWHSTHVEVQGELCWVSSLLLLLHKSQELNSDPPACVVSALPLSHPLLALLLSTATQPPCSFSS